VVLLVPQLKGSEHNDQYNADGTTKTNLSGGIQGGISNGMDVYFRVAFKPVATIMQSQETINSKGELVEMQGKGRLRPLCGTSSSGDRRSDGSTRTSRPLSKSA